MKLHIITLSLIYCYTCYTCWARVHWCLFFMSALHLQHSVKHLVLMMFLQCILTVIMQRQAQVSVGCSLNKTAQWRFAVYGHWSFHFDSNDCAVWPLLPWRAHKWAIASGHVWLMTWSCCFRWSNFLPLPFHLCASFTSTDVTLLLLFLFQLRGRWCRREHLPDGWTYI